MRYIIGLIAGLIIGIGVSYQPASKLALPACLAPSCYPVSGEKAIIDWREGGSKPFCVTTNGKKR